MASLTPEKASLVISASLQGNFNKKGLTLMGLAWGSLGPSWGGRLRALMGRLGLSWGPPQARPTHDASTLST
eukprot:694568-Pyramimonas_sp.AAC.1